MVGIVEIFLEAVFDLMTGGTGRACIVGITAAVFIPIDGVLMACLTDALAAMVEVGNVTAALAIREEERGIEKFDRVGGIGVGGGDLILDQLTIHQAEGVGGGVGPGIDLRWVEDTLDNDGLCCAVNGEYREGVKGVAIVMDKG